MNLGLVIAIISEPRFVAYVRYAWQAENVAEMPSRLHLSTPLHLRRP
jgi:hypothetical protein